MKKRSSSKIAAGAIVIVCVALATGTAIANESHRTSSSQLPNSTASVTKEPVNTIDQPPETTQEEDANLIASEIESLGQTKFAAVYSGIEMQAGKIIVFRRPSEAFDSEVTKRWTTTAIEFRDASFAAENLQDLVTRIANDTEYWSRENIQISSVGARHDGEGVEISTPQPDLLVSKLAGRYGTKTPISVIAGGPATAATAGVQFP